jgi:hypothetical protein
VSTIEALRLVRDCLLQALALAFSHPLSSSREIEFVHIDYNGDTFNLCITQEGIRLSSFVEKDKSFI